MQENNERNSLFNIELELHRSLLVFDKGGVIMQDTELVVTAALCLASGGFHISTENSNPAFAGMGVLVCDQSVVIELFEGVLLCLKN